jgi:uncharacterized protein with HEPN domain
MRNKMIHDYFDVNVKVVWNTIKEDLPRLKQQIEDCSNTGAIGNLIASSEDARM